MNDMTMRGVTTVRKYIADFFAAQLPSLVPIARQQWGLQDYELPLPVRYDSYDPLSATDYPTLGSYVQTSNGWRRVDQGSMHQEYKPRYACRAFVWVRTPNYVDPDTGGTVWVEPEYDSAIRLRDDYLALMRQALLLVPSLSNPGVCSIDEGTLSEDYLEPIKPSTQSSRWLAGGIISFEMSVMETVYEQPIGAVDTTAVTAELMTE